MRLERLAKSRKITKTYTRTNLVPGAPKDARGYLKEGLPSMTIRSGTIFRLLKEMRPDFPFNVVQLNKFSSHRQCQWHVDRKNVGDSLFAMMGSFEGGALTFDDGKLFSQKYKWYKYNGALVGHEVLPFTGERITCILYQDTPSTPLYKVTGDESIPINQEAIEAEQKPTDYRYSRRSRSYC